MTRPAVRSSSPGTCTGPRGTRSSPASPSRSPLSAETAAIPFSWRGAQSKARRWIAVGDAIVGVVANPMSGRDIRRLVTQASVFPTAEKANMIQRMLTAFGAVGVHRVLLSTDLGGISAAVFREIGRRRAADARWPEVEFLDGQPIR